MSDRRDTIHCNLLLPFVTVEQLHYLMPYIVADDQRKAPAIRAVIQHAAANVARIDFTRLTAYRRKWGAGLRVQVSVYWSPDDPQFVRAAKLVERALSTPDPVLLSASGPTAVADAALNAAFMRSMADLVVWACDDLTDKRLAGELQRPPVKLRTSPALRRGRPDGLDAQMRLPVQISVWHLQALRRHAKKNRRSGASVLSEVATRIGNRWQAGPRSQRLQLIGLDRLNPAPLPRGHAKTTPTGSITPELAQTLVRCSQKVADAHPLIGSGYPVVARNALFTLGIEELLGIEMPDDWPSDYQQPEDVLGSTVGDGRFRMNCEDGLARSIVDLRSVGAFGTHDAVFDQILYEVVAQFSGSFDRTRAALVAASSDEMLFVWRRHPHESVEIGTKRPIRADFWPVFEEMNALARKVNPHRTGPHPSGVREAIRKVAAEQLSPFGLTT